MFPRWEWKKIQAKAQKAAMSIVRPYFACVITMAAGIWVLRPAAVLIQTSFSIYFAQKVFDEIAQVRARAAQNRPSRIAAICRGYTKACSADPDPRSQARARVWLRVACA